MRVGRLARCTCTTGRGGGERGGDNGGGGRCGTTLGIFGGYDDDDWVECRRIVELVAAALGVAPAMRRTWGRAGGGKGAVDAAAEASNVG